MGLRLSYHLFVYLNCLSYFMQEIFQKIITNFRLKHYQQSVYCNHDTNNSKITTNFRLISSSYFNFCFLIVSLTHLNAGAQKNTVFGPENRKKIVIKRNEKTCAQNCLLSKYCSLIKRYVNKTFYLNKKEQKWLNGKITWF